MSSSVLEKELEQLQERIGRVNREREALEAELRKGEAELERMAHDRQRFDALKDAVGALEKLRELRSDDLFWDGSLDAGRIAGLLEQARGRVAGFQRELGAVLEKQASLKERRNQCLDDLAFLDEDVRDAYERDERRDEEYVIEREISPVPMQPWSKEAGNEGPFRRNVLIALLAAIFFGVVIPLLKVPAPVHPPVVVVPERLVSMLKKEQPKPAPPKEEEKKEGEKKEETAKEEEKPKEEKRPEPATPQEKAARKKAESSGVLAFKESFKDLIEEAPASRLGARARISNQRVSAGTGRASRSLVALPASAGAGYSGGIAASGISRAIGPGTADQLASVGPAKVESKVAEMAQQARPVSTGPGPARTDEEIQIVFDRYKAALYRMYNTELRRDPTLRGRIILRITIEPGGEVSACTVQSDELGSSSLVADIVARVKRFNFGPKPSVPRTTILYPIDFLPGG